MMILVHMESGLIIPNMATYGILILMTFVLIVREATGYGQMIMDGCGHPIMIGDGLPSTMAAGYMMISMGGSGYPDMNGRQHGWSGVQEVIIMVGHHLGLV